MKTYNVRCLSCGHPAQARDVETDDGIRTFLVGHVCPEVSPALIDEVYRSNIKRLSTPAANAARRRRRDMPMAIG